MFQLYGVHKKTEQGHTKNNPVTAIKYFSLQRKTNNWKTITKWLIQKWPVKEAEKWCHQTNNYCLEFSYPAHGRDTAFAKRSTTHSGKNESRKSITNYFFLANHTSSQQHYKRITGLKRAQRPCTVNLLHYFLLHLGN